MSSVSFESGLPTLYTCLTSEGRKTLESFFDCGMQSTKGHEMIEEASEVTGVTRA